MDRVNANLVLYMIGLTLDTPIDFAISPRTTAAAY